MMIKAMPYFTNISRKYGNHQLSTQANERNRTRTTNRYVKRIKYGNTKPRQDNEDLSQRQDWLFEVVFDYGEH